MHLRAPAPRGLLPPALAIAGIDRVAGNLQLVVGPRPWLRDLASLRPGDSAVLEGPLGRGFDLDPRSRHLLAVADPEGVPAVRGLLTEAIEAGRRVTLLLGARSAAQVWPSSLLPDEVEYVVATEDGSLGQPGSVGDIVPRYEAWADQCVAAGARSLLESLSLLARGRDARLGVARLGRRPGRRGAAGPRPARRQAWLQLVLPHEAGCALGVCLGCVINGRDGPLRVCREGPVVGSDEIAWEPPR